MTNAANHPGNSLFSLGQTVSTPGALEALKAEGSNGG